jgi:hypothetical protein
MGEKRRDGGSKRAAPMGARSTLSFSETANAAELPAMTTSVTSVATVRVKARGLYAAGCGRPARTRAVVRPQR